MSDSEDHDDNHDEEEEEEEQEPEPEPKVLTKEDVATALSLICKCADGTQYGFVSVNVSGKELTDITELKAFPLLRYVDVSNNNLSNISSVSSCTDLLTLTAEGNRLESAALSPCSYLQTLNLSKNQISKLEGVAHPLLAKLDLSGNKISDASGLKSKDLPSLRTLQLHENKLTSAQTLSLPYLTHLYLAKNQITSLAGIDCLVGLKSLHARDNQISTLDGFSASLSSLEYLNLRGNTVEETSELAKLSGLEITAVVLSENPVADTGDYRTELLVAITSLNRIDKDNVEDEERDEARMVAERRKAEQRQEGENTEEELLDG